MGDKIKVGVLGATGSVGQRFVQLLDGHPWFELGALFASERSAGKRYRDAAKWFLPYPMPEEAAEMVVRSTEDVGVDGTEDEELTILFSALPGSVAKEVERRCAQAGYCVASNVSVHRMEKDVPLVIPEVNADHLALINEQRSNRNWRGFIVTNPNCSTIVLALTLKPLMQFGITEVRVATMQAVSGAGYAGVPSMAILDNVIPYIEREEAKMESEPLKILGTLEGSRIRNASFTVCASCHRVPVMDGHTEAVWVKFEEEISESEVKEAFENFNTNVNIKTPFAPRKPIILREERDRPQPKLDRDAGRGMSVSVGRIRPGRMKNEIKYVAVGHNTIRGAAGASILNAEVMVKRGYI